MSINFKNLNTKPLGSYLININNVSMNFAISDSSTDKQNLQECGGVLFFSIALLVILYQKWTVQLTASATPFFVVEFLALLFDAQSLILQEFLRLSQIYSPSLSVVSVAAIFSSSLLLD